MTRKSTPKHNVIHVQSGNVVFENKSKTEATELARLMSADRKKSFIVVRVTKLTHS